MKKKFIISGVAVFLVVLLCSSTLFAFADFSSNLPFCLISFENRVFTSVTDFVPDFPSPDRTDKGGKLYPFSAPSGFYYVFESSNVPFYLTVSTLTLYGFDTRPEVGVAFTFYSVQVDGTLVDDSFNGSAIYSFTLPDTYSYYIRTDFYYYEPNVVSFVNGFIPGLISVFGALLVNMINTPVIGVTCIAIPVFALIIYFVFKLSFGRSKKFSHKSRRRRK